ncbi:zinc finger protein 618-like, partial [Aphis craccivora]
LKLLKIELEENIFPDNLHLEHNVTIQNNISNSSPFSEWEDGENYEDLDNRSKFEKELEVYKKEKFYVIDDSLLDFWNPQNHIFPH